MDPKLEPEPVFELKPERNGTSSLPIYGEFTGGNGKVRYALKLTESELTVQKLVTGRTGTGTGTGISYRLSDCVGSRAHGTSFTVYFYPLKKRRLSSGVARQRVELCFRVPSLNLNTNLNLNLNLNLNPNPNPNPNLNLNPNPNQEEARRWARAVREGSQRNRARRTGRLLILLNPHSGKGQAHALFTSHVQGILQEADVPYTLIITERQNHARELVRETDLSQWEALVIMSGDGLLFEIVNGLMEREDWEEAIKIPLGVLPGGSGNALAASIHYYSGWQLSSSEDLLLSCGFLLCKGPVCRLDLTSVCMASGQRLFSFLSLAWGFVADVDIESEKYRHVGAARFTLGTLVRLASLRVYQGRLAYLLADDSQTKPGLEMSPKTSQSIVKDSEPLSRDPFCHSRTLRNSSTSNNSQKVKRTNPAPVSALGPPDSLLVPLDQPVPSNWTVVSEEDFVLVLAVYQSHLSEDLIAAPASRLEDGVIHLIYVKAGISRMALLRLFLAMEKGTHLSINCPYVVYVKVRALRLEPYSPKGTITVDGELMDYGPLQAQVHGGLARLIASQEYA